MLAALLVAAAAVERLRPGDPCPPAESRGAPVRPERIVSITPAMTEMLFELGAFERVVGVTRFCDWPSSAANLPKVGDFMRPDVERIVELRPDLVVGTTGPENARAVAKLREFGIRVVVRPAYTTAQLLEAIRAVGAEVGEPDAARTLSERIRGAFDEVRRSAALRPRRKVLFVVSHGPVYAAAEGSIPGELIRAAGGVNVVGARAGKYVPFSIEQAVAAAPDVIIDASMLGASDAKFWREWREIPAVRGGRVHPAGGDYVYMPGPRVYLGLREVYALIHPEARVTGGGG